MVSTVVANLEQQVAWVTESQRPIGLSEVFDDHVIDHLLSIGHAKALSHQREEPAELVLAGVDDLDLVGNAAQERLVDQLARFEVGRKHHQLIERHLDLFAVRKTEIIVARLQGHDPPVQQFVGAHLLPAEIVDHQRAAVALQLQRRLADAGRHVDRHFELRHGQFTAGHQRRPANANPTLVDLLRIEQSRIGRQRLTFVVHRIVEAHDFAVDADRPRNPDRVAKGGGDPLGDARLAVARRAEQEQSPPRVDRRSQPIQHQFAQQKALERAVKALDRRVLVRQRLGLHTGNVIFQGDGRRAEVGAVLRITPPSLAAQIAKLVLEIVHRRRPAMDDQLAVFHLAEQFIDQHEGELHLTGDVASRGVASGQKKLQDQRLHFAIAQLGGVEGRRFDRCELFRSRRLRLRRIAHAILHHLR